MQRAISRDPYTIGAGSSPDHAPPLLSALFLVFAGFVLLRIALNSLLLNLFVDYASDSGSAAEKLHPAFYGFVIVALVALPCFRIVLSAWEVRVVRAMLGFNAGIVLILVATFLAGRGGSAGFLIDTYCGATLAILLFLFPPAWRLQVGHTLILWLALSAPVAIAEYGLKVRLQPFDEAETAFRPIGLTTHPLELGLWMAIGPAFTAATAWSLRTKLALSALFLAGLGVSGARTALVVGLVVAPVLALGAVGARVSPQRRFERRIILATALVALIPLGILALAASGGLDRFGTGPADANVQTRIDIYGVFTHMTWEEILLGMNPEAMRAIAKTYFKLEVIESPVVMFVTLFGAVGSVLFAVLLAWVLRTLLVGAKACTGLGVAVFFVVALSSNGLSGKGSAIFLLFTLIIAFHPAQRPPGTRA